jgi:DnaJ-class molecular chaperone
MGRRDVVPDCGACNGTGKVTVEVPRNEKDDTVTWHEQQAKCTACNGTGKCC